MKNKHLDHIEDLIFDGRVREVVDTLKTISNAISEMGSREPPKGLSISTKFDGAPSIVFGTNPENQKFFVGTKSVFNKKIKKIAHSKEEIDLYYGNDPGLAHKLKEVFEAFDRHPEGVWQADLMYLWDDLEVNDKMVSFCPNTVTYHITVGDPLCTDIVDSSVGLAVHTKYVGESIDDMVAEPGYASISMVCGNPSICFINSDINLRYKAYTPEEYIFVQQSMSLADIAPDDLNSIAHHSKFLKMFTNYCVRIGESYGDVEMYKRFLINRGETALAAEVELNDMIVFNIAFKLFELITMIKVIMMQALVRNNQFYCEINNKPSMGEGFVVHTDLIYCKLVNRMEFSRSNFMNTKFEEAKK